MCTQWQKAPLQPPSNLEEALLSNNTCTSGHSMFVNSTKYMIVLHNCHTDKLEKAEFGQCPITCTYNVSKSLNQSSDLLICSRDHEKKKLNVDQISQREPPVPGATDSPLLCSAHRKLNSLFTCHSLDFVNCRGDRGTGWGGGGCERTSVPVLRRWWHIRCHVKPKCARPLTDTGHTRIEPHARWRMPARADGATNKKFSPCVA